MQLGLQMAQRARGADTWATIASRGRTGVARMVDDLCELANRMARRIVEGSANLLAPVGLSQMLFSFGSDNDTDRVIAAVQEDGRCWVGGTQRRRCRAMRVSVCDTSMNAKGIDESAAAILYCWRSFAHKATFTESKALSKKTEHNELSIVPYDARFQIHFRRLNESWIDEYFEMEATDHKVLGNPKQYIIDSGGTILFAMEGDTIVGTCALVNMDNGQFDFELAKMAVDPRCRGRGIGQRLGEAIIDCARELGANTVFLESNTILAPAIKLYRKLGFVEIERQPTPYARGNIHMVLDLTKTISEVGGKA